jgi:hypothetical protein
MKMRTKKMMVKMVIQMPTPAQSRENESTETARRKRAWTKKISNSLENNLGSDQKHRHK